MHLDQPLSVTNPLQQDDVLDYFARVHKKYIYLAMMEYAPMGTLILIAAIAKTGTTIFEKVLS